MNLNFKYLPKLGNAIAVNISHGRILTNVDSGDTDEGDNTIEKWKPNFWVDVRKNVTVESNGNNIEVMAKMVELGLVKPKDDGHTLKVINEFISDSKVTDLPENKYAAAVTKNGEDVSKWHVATVKMVNKYFGFEEAETEKMIENIKSKV